MGPADGPPQGTAEGSTSGGEIIQAELIGSVEATVELKGNTAPGAQGGGLISAARKY